MIAPEPTTAAAVFNAGKSLKDRGRHLEAAERFHAALCLDPSDADAAYMLGNCLRELGSLDDAVVAYDVAIALRPHAPDALTNRGIVLRRLGRIEEAIRSFRQAITLNPRHPEAHWNLALGLLLTGAEDEGWREYEWRWALSSFPRSGSAPAAPRWDGRVDRRATVLLRAEQGFGDMIQFARYAPLVAERCRTVIVECPPELARLMATLDGVGSVIASGDPLPPHTFECPFMSLPSVQGFAPGGLQWTVPYLHAETQSFRSWERALDHCRGMRVGLVWGGRTGAGSDADRSIALEQLLPLSAVPGIDWISVQRGAARAQLDGSGWDMVDAGPRLADFAETASMLAHLDLVITIDSAVAHLAGALGKPVWTLLPFAADWRWVLARDDSPWYPTMRLFRQSAPGDWARTVDDVARQLRDAVQNEHGRERGGSPATRKAAADVAAATQRHIAGDLAGALTGYTRALNAGADSPGLYANLGLLMSQLGRDRESEQMLRRALALDPDHVAALNGLGMMHMRNGMMTQARKAFQRGLRAAPGSAVLRNNIGITLGEGNGSGEERAWFRGAIRADDSLVDAHWNLAQAALSDGLLEEGWTEYEWRWRKPDFTSPNLDLERPAWDGSPLAGRSILVHAEQGFGDTLQFSRYLREPRLDAGRVVFLVQPALLDLMRHSFPRAEVVAWGDPVRMTDVHIPLMSVPRILRTTVEGIPSRTPYLLVPPQSVSQWRDRIDRPAGSIAAGVVWQGRPTQRQDRTRSLPLAALQEAFDVTGVSWHSLQLGEAASELGRIGSTVRDLSVQLKSFSDTAAAIMNLDLIVSVDTAVAHLAGALGRPVWVMLAIPADWRWLRRREDSPWYPTMELIRQEASGAWEGVVGRIASRLRDHVARVTTTQSRPA